MSRSSFHSSKGFTLVELLIVIVVIAILAAISIVAYNGIQERARNSAKISIVGNISKLMKLYYVGNQNYPVVTGVNMCLTSDNICTAYNGTVIASTNSSLLDPLREFGTVPESTLDNTGRTYYGINYIYNASLTLNSVPNPVIIMFWLDGINKSCKNIAGMTSVTDTGTPNVMIESTSSKANTTTNQTRCYLMYPS